MPAFLAMFAKTQPLHHPMKIINKYLSLVKFSHTIFAMPFAAIGFMLGLQNGEFTWWLLLQVTICMVTARTAAMGFNRLIDKDFDAKNPRTASREIPSGAISSFSAKILIATCSLLFIATCATINLLCLYLSPVALAVVLGYSYTKRFTSLCHLVLGLGLSIAPIGAYIAVTGEFAVLPLLFSGLVFTWVAGFDIIFALQDIQFDKEESLNSIPAKMGLKNALITSTILHVVTAMTAIIIGLFYINNVWYWVGASIFVSLLVYQHSIVKPSDLSRVGLAFGTTNGVASVVYSVFIALALFAVHNS